MIDKLRGYFRAGNFRHPAVAAVAVIFLFAGLVLASSMETYPVFSGGDNVPRCNDRRSGVICRPCGSPGPRGG